MNYWTRRLYIGRHEGHTVFIRADNLIDAYRRFYRRYGNTVRNIHVF